MQASEKQEMKHMVKKDIKPNSKPNTEQSTEEKQGDGRWTRECLLYIPALVLLLLAGSRIFEPARLGHPEWINDRDVYVYSALQQPEDTIDLAVLGDSEAMVLLSPEMLEKETGISAYITGQSGQSSSESYYVLRELCKKQHPKVVIFEPDTLVDDSNERRELIENFNTAAYHMFPVLRHHGCWKYMTGTETKSTVEHDRGFSVRDDVVPYEGGEYMLPTEKKAYIPPSSRRYFEKIVSLCEKQQTRLILVSAPAPSHFNFEKHNAIEMLAEEKGLTYMDLNLCYDETGIDFTTDMLDGGDHINLSGTQKVTKYLAGELLDHLQEAQEEK